MEKLYKIQISVNSIWLEHTHICLHITALMP